MSPTFSLSYAGSQLGQLADLIFFRLSPLAATDLDFRLTRENDDLASALNLGGGEGGPGEIW